MSKQHNHVSDNIEFGDKRLNKRMHSIAESLSAGVSGDSIPRLLSNQHQSKGYYRFINNARVTNTLLIKGVSDYVRGLVQSLNGSQTVLAIQDTTELDFTGNRSASGLGVMEYENRKGIYLHNHLLVSDIGIPYGLFSQQYHNRNAENLGASKITHKQVPLERKESYKWLKQFEELQDVFKQDSHLQIIQVCDREADIYELLSARKYPHIHYIIRSCQNRACRKVGINEKTVYIWEEAERGEASFVYQLEVETPKRNKRVADVSVVYKKVTLRPPYRKAKKFEEQEVWVVVAKEHNPSEDVIDPICWELLTSIPVLDNQTALKIIQYYTLRWVIERFHYVLKQCCRVENFQIEKREALQNAIILQSWAAIQVCSMDYLFKKKPQTPLSETIFLIEDYNIAHNYAKKVLAFKEEYSDNPTISNYIRVIAKIAGHHLQNNKSIGALTLCEGFKRLAIIKAAINMPP